MFQRRKSKTILENEFLVEGLILDSKFLVFVWFRARSDNSIFLAI